MRNPPSTGAVPFEGFECDNNGDCLFFGVANIHWYLVDHDEADEDLRKEMSDIHHETNPETSHRRQLDPKTTLGVIHVDDPDPFRGTVARDPCGQTQG